MYAWSSLKAGSLDKRTTAVACENKHQNTALNSWTNLFHTGASQCEAQTGLKNSCSFPPAVSFVIGSTRSYDVLWSITMNTLVFFFKPIKSFSRCSLRNYDDGCIVGGAVASWLVRSTLYRAVRVQALAGDIVLYSWSRPFTLIMPPSIQVYKWVLVINLRWTSIPSSA